MRLKLNKTIIGGTQIRDEQDRFKCEWHDTYEEAELVVKATNNHEPLMRALEWALPSAELDVERLGNALAGPSITPRMREEYEREKAKLADIRALLKEQG